MIGIKLSLMNFRVINAGKSCLPVPVRIISLVLTLLLPLAPGIAQVNFEDYFLDKAMRVDLVFSGDNSKTEIQFRGIRVEPYWGGNKLILTDPFGYGEYKLQVRDDSSGIVIFSKGFSTLFSEWQTTAEAGQLKRSFDQVLVFPYPKYRIILELFERSAHGSFEKIYELPVDPASSYINRDCQAPVKVTDIMLNGDPGEKVDIVFVAEGYTEEEMGKYISDVERFTDYLFSRDPFSRYKGSFNVRAVQSVSLESGTDIPGNGTWKNTACNSSFYTFGIDRYLTTFDYRSVCDYAGHVPYDQIFVLVNSSKYGGGGIYNHYSMGTSGHLYSEKVFIHEFGHAFAGLGDEYFNSEVAYSDFYPLDVEPWEPNLTTLVNFDAKWKDMLAPGTPVPTPEEPQYIDKTGVFEGGGYVARGVYRPAVDCTMRNTSKAEEFCAVCKRSIVRMISYYTGQ
jgi:hypothetical protein